MLRHGCLASLCLATLVASGWAEEDRDVIGKWERSQNGEGGKVFRLVKEHQDGQTTVTTYDAAGAVLAQHRSQYKVRKTEDVRVFEYSNVEVTHGPNEGQTAAGPFSYAYRIEADSFYEFGGVLLADSTPPMLLVWTRVKDKSPTR
jgi:YD repeat-containing protein